MPKRRERSRRLGIYYSQTPVRAVGVSGKSIDDAGDVQVVAEDQAAEEIDQARGVRLLSAGRRLRLEVAQVCFEFLD